MAIFSSSEYALTDGATITIDAQMGTVFTVTLGGNRTFAAPTNPSTNQLIILRVKQDGTGTRTITWNAVFAFSTGLPAPTLTTTAGRTDILGFMYSTALSKWLYIAEILDFNV